MYRDRYAKYYAFTTETDARGRERQVARYAGNYKRLVLDDGSAKNFKYNALLLAGAMLVLTLAAGFVNNDGMRVLYAALPYVALLAAEFFLIAGTWRLPSKAVRMQLDEFESSHGRMKWASIAALIAAGAASFGEAVYCCLGKTRSLMLELLFLLAMLACAALAFFFIRRQSAVRVEELEP